MLFWARELRKIHQIRKNTLQNLILSSEKKSETSKLDFDCWVYEFYQCNSVAANETRHILW